MQASSLPSEDKDNPVRLKSQSMKCHRLFGPQFSKVNPSFVSQIRQMSDTLTPNVGVFGETRRNESDLVVVEGSCAFHSVILNIFMNKSSPPLLPVIFD